MAGLANFPNPRWTRAVLVASASAVLFTGTLAADNNKKAAPAATPAPRAAAPAPRAAAPSGGGGGGGGHATPSAPGRATPSSAGHATPSAAGRATPSAPGHATPSAPGHATPSFPGHATPSAAGHATPSAPGHNAPMAGSDHNPAAGGGHNPAAGGGHVPGAGGGAPGGGGRNNGQMAGGGRTQGANSAPRVGPQHSPAMTSRTVHNTPSGQQVAMHGGRPSEIRSRDMMIRRGPSGMRRTVVERGGRTYSFNRAGNGHIRSAYHYGGREYAVRHYYVGGAAFPRYYRSYGYRGVFFDAYAPSVYYSPFYYGWAYQPWAAPVVYSWGWGRSPWYGYYGGYFTPYQSYPSANLWLTDYIVAQTLENSYRERVESARAANMQYNDQPPPQQAVMTPEIKALIAEEVQRQLSYEAAEARSRVPVDPGAPPVPAGETDYTGVGRMIDDNRTHALISNANIDVTTLTGQECAIGQGDAVAIIPGQASGEGETARVRVLASTGGCPSNSVVTISLQDLQEMVNHLRGTLDGGLAAMQKEAKLPKPPSTVPTRTVTSEFASSAPPADPNEAAELARLNQEASTTEQSTLKEASFSDTGAGSGSGGGPLTQRPDALPFTTQATELQPGMTPDQVRAIKGAPSSPPTKFGAKEIWTYPDVKLTFMNGKLSDMN